MSYLVKENIENLEAIKLDLVAEAVFTNNMEVLKSAKFFKNYERIIKSRKLSTGDRIWFGRRLKEVYTDKSAPNPGNIAIFQKPDEFKDIRKWERETNWNGFSQTI